ncbi:translation initiation factor IF-2 associated domain-containing protein, partial [Streptomyces galilaeus]
METGQVRQSFSHGRSKPVLVEKKRKFTIIGDTPAKPAAAAPAAAPAPAAPARPAPAAAPAPVAAAPAPAAKAPLKAKAP